MARDRQRSKARQRRRAKAGGDSGHAPSRENGFADDTPDVLRGATPYADEARLAEAGPADEARIAEAGRGDDYERAPDVAEDDLRREAAEAGGGGRRGGGGAGEREVAEEPKDRSRILTFLQACVAELRRVDWPDRKHVFQATAVVLGFVLIAGGWLGLMDAIWQPVVNAIL